MTLKISNVAARQSADAIVGLIDAGSGAGALRIYGGDVPADADTAISDQTLLAELAFSDPAFLAAVDVSNSGRATADTITPGTGLATGTATFFRAVDGDGVTVLQGAVATSDADLNLITTAIVVGQPVQVSSLTFTQTEG